MMRTMHAGFLGGLCYAGGLILTPAAEPPKPVVIKVNDCELAKAPLKTRPAKDVLGEVTGDKLEAFAPVGDEQWVADATKIRHPFIAAAHLAFAEHRPLAISPDMTHYKSTGSVDVDFIWDYLGKTYPMKIRAGFMGVEQDPKTLTLKPRTAWQVMHVTLSPEEREAVDYLSR